MNREWAPATRQALAMVVVAAALVLPAWSNAETAKAKWPVYEGKAFKVSYPPGWKAEPLSAQNRRDSDAATFTSPDGTMQFYLFSPLWGGTAPGIALDPATEVETARKSDAGASSGVRGTYTWYTIAATNQRYTRTYQDFLADDASIHWVIGMRFANGAALERFRPDYARFKQSLEQYAD